MPPGQRALESFPRFGVPFAAQRLTRPGPAVVRIGGALERELDLSVARLRELERRSIVADFHCVAGWTAPGLRWSGVPFRALCDSVIVPEARPHPRPSHVVFRCADGYCAVLTLEDALDVDVLLADELDGRALSVEHGAPVRLVSPKQYGYKSAKHLSAIELHPREPTVLYTRLMRRMFNALLAPHPRARVAAEERHRYLASWMIRGLYRSMIKPSVWYWKRPLP